MTAEIAVKRTDTRDVDDDLAPVGEAPRATGAMERSAAANAIQARVRRRQSSAGPPGGAAERPPAAQGRSSTTRYGLLLCALVGLNYALTELMDESGLPVLLVQCAPTAKYATAIEQSKFADQMRSAVDEAAGSKDIIRLDVLQAKPAAALGTGAHTVLIVHARGRHASQLPDPLAALFTSGEAVALQTVFPERSRWRRAPLRREKEEPALLGEMSPLAQHATLRVRADAAAAFERAWSDLGYNALGEPGVLRCDLLRHESTPGVYVARKVFRDAGALSSHEGSEHYRRWRALVTADGAGGAMLLDSPRAILLDGLHPRTSVVPFRSEWATV